MVTLEESLPFTALRLAGRERLGLVMHFVVALIVILSSAFVFSLSKFLLLPLLFLSRLSSLVSRLSSLSLSYFSSLSGFAGWWKGFCVDFAIIFR